MQELILFMHLIKTGGSTISCHLSKHLAGFRDMDNPKYDSEGETRFIAGHGVHWKLHERWPDHDCKYMTILRNPADWLVSAYHHDITRGRKNVTFEKWYEQSGGNSVNVFPGHRNRMVAWMTRQMTHGGNVDTLKGMLDKCWWVGITEWLDSDLHWLFTYLGVPTTYTRKRVAGEHDEIDGVQIKKVYQLTEDMRRRIYEENPEDVELYTHAVERNARNPLHPW